MKLIYFFLVLPILLLACKAQKSSNQDEQLLISMQRTPCLGTCPAYIFEIYESGRMKLVGEKYYKYQGTYESKLSSGELERLKNLFLEKDFFNYKDRYVNNMTDLPSTYVYFAHEGKNKKILDYQGTPQAIKDLEKSLDEVIEKSKWKKLSNSRE